MTDQTDIHTGNFRHFHSGRTGRARGQRRTVVLAIIAATTFAGSTLIGTGRPAAMQLSAAPATSPMLAYAQPLPERFGATAFHDVSRDETIDDLEEEGHELNDAWMGMTAVSAEGIVLGHVTDAFVNPDGTIDEIVIQPEGDGGVLRTPVYVPAELAFLGTETVQITIDARSAALLEPALDLARLD